MARFSKLHKWMCFAALAIAPAGSAGAQDAVFTQDGPEKFLWRSEVLNRDDVQAELGDLYVTLQTNGALTTKQVSIEKGETPTDVMIRNGVWPHWLKNRMPLSVDAMLCDLNPDICRADRKGGSDWTRAWPGRTLNLPDVSLELSYKVGVRNTAELTAGRSDVEVVETSDLSALWCRRTGPQHELCKDNEISGGWTQETPAIYQYVYDSNVDVERFAKVASPSALKELGASESPVKMVAVPVVEARVGTGAASKGEFSRVIQDLSNNVLVDQKLRLQSFFETNAKRFRPMGFVDENGKPSRPWREGENLSPVKVAHIDAAAELTHCAFGQGVALKRWNFDTQELEDVERPAQIVAAAGGATDAGPACGLLNSTPLVEKSHGTHTLGLLVDLLTLGGNIQTPAAAGEPPITIYHVPIGLSQANQIGMEALEEVVQLLPWWDVKVVNMSIAWNKADSRPIEDAIVRLPNTIFVAAAGNHDETSGCSVSPACIESSNVISVIGLDLDDNNKLKILKDSNYGSRYHDIGAIGANLVSSVDGGMIGPLSGTSQAAPLVSAAIGHLIRRGKTGIEDIYQRIMTTAVLDSKLLEASKATMIDMRRAMDFDVDFLELNNGCKMRGEFRGFVTVGDIVAADVESGGHFYLSEPDLRRVFYNEREDWHLMMHVRGHEFLRRAYQIEPDHLQREFRFLPATLENCGDQEADAVARFKLAEVHDLMLASR